MKERQAPPRDGVLHLAYGMSELFYRQASGEQIS